MSNPSPFDFTGAREAAHAASRAQANAAQLRADTTERLAQAERAYRVALAQRIVELHAEGTAWSTAGDVARGDKHVADLRYDRDVAAGVAEAAEQEAWRCSADRRSLEALIAWSRAVAPDGQHNEDLRVAAGSSGPPS